MNKKYTQSRAEKDLSAIIDGDESLLEKNPQSRMEELLIKLYDKCKEQQDTINQLNSKLIRSYLTNIGGTGVLEIAGNICILQYTSGTFVPGNYVPDAYKPKFSNGVWAAVSSINYGPDYRLAVLSNGRIVLQKDGADVTEDTNVRGQIMWIV